MHLLGASNLVARGVDGEDEGEDDREEGSRVRIVAEKGGSHTTDNNVNGDSRGNEETSRDGVHAGEVSHSGGTTENQHGADDDVRSKTIIYF